MVCCRRLKTFVWLTAIVVCLQFFVFVADQVWSKNDAVIEDCTVSKSRDIILPRNAYKHPPLNTHNSSSPTARSIPTEKTTSRVLEKLTETTNAIPASTSSNATPKPEYNCRRLENRTSVNGFLNLHEWYDWCGHTVDDLRRNPLFPFKPNTNTLLQKFVINDTKGFFNARRIFGYIHPPATGDYVLAVSSADGSDLWLSTDDNPKNSRKIAYIGEPENQYADSTQFLEFTSKKSQISGLIRLEAGRVYYVEALQKQKKNRDHIEVAWKKPGSEKLEVIDSQHISQYIDYSADQQEINTRTACICSDHPTLKLAYDEFMTREKYDMRDDFPFRVENLPFSEVSDVLSSCPYHPSYLVSRKLKEDEAIYKGFILQPRVYPDDRTNINMSHDINNHISLGNKKLPEEEALQIVTEYMNSLKKAKGERFTLKHIVNVEMKEDPKKGKRYFLELELADKERGRSVGFSEYVYKTNDSNSGLCYPEGHQWKRNVSITAIVTVKNYGSWIKYLVDQLAEIYQKGLERNFYLIIADFNSTDVDLFKLREKSVLRDRISILQQGTVFHKTKALNEAVKYVKDPHSIIFTVDLHMKFPPNVFDNIRKHAVEGRSFYSPAVLKIKCGYSIAHQQAYWEMMGYGLFGGYKSDWGRFGGMDAEKFTTRWGGEDWDLMDRAIGAELEIERLRLPKFYHYYHERKSDWYEFARV